MLLSLRNTERANYGHRLQLPPADVVAAAEDWARETLDEDDEDEDEKAIADFVDEPRRRSCNEELSC